MNIVCENYNIVKKIGEGSSSIIFLAISKKDKKQYENLPEIIYH